MFNKIEVVCFSYIIGMVISMILIIIYNNYHKNDITSLKYSLFSYATILCFMFVIIDIIINKTKL